VSEHIIIYTLKGIFTVSLFVISMKFIFVDNNLYDSNFG